MIIRELEADGGFLSEGIVESEWVFISLLAVRRVEDLGKVKIAIRCD